MVNVPSARVAAAPKLQAGSPGAEPLSPIRSPLRSKTCHAIDPPRCQPVPSVQTRRVSPREFTASRGCLRPFAAPGAAMSFGTASPETFPNSTCPPVSQAAYVFPAFSANDMLLIGQALISQGSTFEP